MKLSWMMSSLCVLVSELLEQTKRSSADGGYMCRTLCTLYIP